MSNRERVLPLSETANRVIGRGISFPFSFNGRGRSKSLQLQEGAEKINQSIHIILATKIGERLFEPEFGSNLPNLVFEPADEPLFDSLYFHTVSALRRWEPRITINNVVIIEPDAMVQTFKTDNNVVGIRIDYTINKFHTTGSYVYPFQLGGMPVTDTITSDQRYVSAALTDDQRQGIS